MAGGYADGAPATSANSKCPNASGHAHSGAATGAAWGTLEVPGIAGDASYRTIGDAFEAKLGGGGLAQNDGACRLEAFDYRSILRRYVMRIQLRAAHGPHILGNNQVFDRHRHTMQWP